MQTEMICTTGHYINVYLSDAIGKCLLDVFILLNEANSEPSYEENKAIQELVEDTILSLYPCSKDELVVVLWNLLNDSSFECLSYGVQVFVK